jgi:tRNA U34 5-methylaminomethyl-2-thiouridine-forming methyltransferase MnmC
LFLPINLTYHTLFWLCKDNSTRAIMPASDWTPQLTQDGSFTLFSSEFGESFHSRDGAKSEAFQKFVHPTDLLHKAQQPQIKLLDICYGLGYNTAAAIETIWQVNPACHIQLYGLELDPTVPIAAAAPPLIDLWTPPTQEILTALANHHHYKTPQLNAQLLIGDARQTLRAASQIPQGSIQGSFQADVIFFDPFSPQVCPQLWTVEFFQLVAACLAPTGKLATYCRAAATRAALIATGFSIGNIPLETIPRRSHEWSQGTIAALTPLPDSLSIMEQQHLQTRAAVPYRDPSLNDPDAVIIQRRQQEQQQSLLESTTAWRKRWGIH